MNFVSAQGCEMPSELRHLLTGYRYGVFVRDLGWRLQAPEGREEDQFDRPDTLYVVARDTDGNILGCCRLLPTTRPYLLRDVFPGLLGGIAPPQRDDIWELSRFAATASSPAASAPVPPRLAERVLLQALRVCTRRGAQQLLAVTTLAVERLMRRAGVDVQRMGPPALRDGSAIIAVVININERSISALEAHECLDGEDAPSPSSCRAA
jgi:acyl homoserine lactone synthase